MNSGVTGILVSHSLDQIRKMCNKVLWLDRGNQVCFSDNATEACYAYAEYLITKDLPHGDNDIRKLSEDYLLRKRDNGKKQRKTEADRLIEALEKSDVRVAKDAINRYVSKYKLDLNMSGINGWGE